MTLGLAASFLQDGGEMGRRIRALDWQSHPLGVPDGWPQALRTVARLMLTTQHPTLIFWGPQLFCLYNDAFAASLGPERHPAMLGAEARTILVDSWPIVGADIEAVLAGHGSTYRENRLVPSRRHGVVENAYWTYSYSPIDHEGAVGGVLVLCTETTSQVRDAERRDAERMRQQRLFEQAPGFITIMRGPNLIVEFVNDAHRDIFGSEDWIGKPIRTAFPSIEGQGFFEHLDRVYETGQSFEATAVPAHFHRAPGMPQETRYLTFIYAPLHDDEGRVTGVFCEGFDVTRGMHADIRHAALAELADRMRDIEEPDAIAYAAAETLAGTLGVSRAGYGTIDKRAETITIERDWNAPGIQSLAGVLHFRDYGSYIDDLKAGRTVVVEDAERDPRTADMAGSLKAISAQAFVNMPVTEQGDFVALLFLNHAVARVWTDEDLALIRDVAERTRNAVARREAEQALRENEARLRFLDGLGSAAASARDADAVMAVTTRMLGEHLGASDCAYADMEDDENLFNIRGDWHAAEFRSIVGRYSLTSFGSVANAQLRAGKPLVVNDVADLGEDGAKAFAGIGSRSMICMPFLKEGRLTALMAVHNSVPRCWTTAEIDLLQEVTLRSWAHIERARAQADLRESERRLRLTIDGARIGTWEWDVPARRGHWSARTLEILGIESGDAITFEKRFDSIHPDNREAVREEITRSAQETGRFSAEYRILRPDGGVRWVASRGLVERDATGAALRVTGTTRDVTERREAQIALQRINETLEQRVADRTAERDRMWRLSGDLFMVIGKRGEIRAVNPALTQLLGYTADEVIGERFSRFTHPEDLSSIARAWRAASQGPLRDFIARLRSRYGSWRHFAWNAAPGDGEAYVIGRDVTSEIERREELEQAQEALRQSQKMESLGQLTGGVAHDFNNLLTPILGSLDLLRRSKTAGERELRLIGGALESAERARTLVQRLLAFARRQPLQPGPVDLAVLVNGMAGLIASTLGPQIRLDIALPDNLPPAHADANQLEMAILNLSVNSRDAMPGGGDLTIRVTQESIGSGHQIGLASGDYLCLAVTDTGVGMDASTKARAIEPFFSTKGIGKGTGLGLSMVHGLTSQLGGAMLLTSRPGEGTTVALYLPVDRDGLPEASPSQIACMGGGGGRILLVDDEASVRTATGELLRDLGYEVVEASNAREALDYLDRENVDFLVSDHLMPGMNGTELARVVRTRRPDLPVLIVSGYAELEGVASDLPRLAKPFRQDELGQMLARISSANRSR
ncbi:PAS domain-containing protein [Sphingomonas sp. MMS12-HWE2-04]|uniref:PAS domain-containing protein n=1 Tax=Sphingomonas sp. MMS12-HWE2-04 TaxID=3234199 RepID=UPI0038507484